MPKISSSTELALMCMIGLVSTVYEGTVQNMNDNVKAIWSSNFTSIDTSVGMESILKSAMTAVALARGLTVHVYIASYLLMGYPLIVGRGVTILLLWMLICALRSVVVNLVALGTGCVLCSLHAELKPVCFEFVTTKAIEIACSVFMWLSVNDYHLRLRTIRRELSTNRKPQITLQQFSKEESELSISSDSSSELSFLEFEDEEVASSEDSLIVKAAVDWLMRMAFGLKYENRRMEMDTARAERFLHMTPNELSELQNRIQAKLNGKQANEKLGEKSIHEPTEASPSHSSSELTSSMNIKEVDSEPSNIALGTTRSKGTQTREPSKKLKERLFSKGNLDDLKVSFSKRSITKTKSKTIFD